MDAMSLLNRLRFFAMFIYPLFKIDFTFVKTGILFSMVCYWQEAFVNQWHIVHSSFPTADAVICGPQMGQFGYFFLVPLKMLGSA
jgi:hypothetical protein